MSISEGRELIWVDKEFAERYKVLDSDKKKNDERLLAFEEYMKSVSDQATASAKADFEHLEENLAMYRGLMLKIKTSYESAYHEHCASLEKVFDNIHEQMPNVTAQIKKITGAVDLVKQASDSLNKSINMVQTYSFEKFTDLIERYDRLSVDGKSMFAKLVDLDIENRDKQEAASQASKPLTVTPTDNMTPVVTIASQSPIHQMAQDTLRDDSETNKPEMTTNNSGCKTYTSTTGRGRSVLSQPKAIVNDEYDDRPF